MIKMVKVLAIPKVARPLHAPNILPKFIGCLYAMIGPAWSTSIRSDQIWFTSLERVSIASLPDPYKVCNIIYQTAKWSLLAQVIFKNEITRDTSLPWLIIVFQSLQLHFYSLLRTEAPIWHNLQQAINQCLQVIRHALLSDQRTES